MSPPRCRDFVACYSLVGFARTDSTAANKLGFGGHVVETLDDDPVGVEDEGTWLCTVSISQESVS